MYVDDIFVMFQSWDHVEKFVDYMNTKYPNIRFTSEIEDQNSFSFLDIKLIRNTEEKPCETLVYRKSTFDGVFTNFKSFISMKRIWIAVSFSLLFNMLFL